MSKADIISLEEATTLSALFRERVSRSAGLIAYQHYDTAGQRWVETTWGDMANEVGRWQQVMLKAGLSKGDRVGVMLRNSREWILFDQSALGLGLVTVPLYVEDRPENAAYIIADAGVKLLIVEGRDQWQNLLAASDGLPGVNHILSINPIEAEDQPGDSRLSNLNDWLFGVEGELQTVEVDKDELASIVYTSGTTGYPKGVMLSHWNILTNAWDSAHMVDLHANEVFLSFLPLSHTLERTIGYYVPVMVAGIVAFSRSIALLPEDLLHVRPTVLLSVPRIYERVYGRIVESLPSQPLFKRAMFSLAYKVGWRRFQYEQKESGWTPLLLLWPIMYKLVGSKIMARLGGRVRIAICGGAPLQPDINRLFTSMGLTLLQGYGLTEASPVISVNQPVGNKPGSIGRPLPSVQVRISEEGEIQTKSACVMLGYWNNPEATQAAFTEDGWLKTGDVATMDEDGFLYITGRIKEIIVMSNGEKLPPSDMELAIALDPLIEQVMVIGESRPCLSVIAVLNRSVWGEIAQEYGVNPDDSATLMRADVVNRVLERIAGMLKQFPGYAQVKLAYLTLEPWTVENGLLTPTLKLKRTSLLEKYQAEIEAMYRS